MSDMVSTPSEPDFYFVVVCVFMLLQLYAVTITLIHFYSAKNARIYAFDA